MTGSLDLAYSILNTGGSINYADNQHTRIKWFHHFSREGQTCAIQASGSLIIGCRDRQIQLRTAFARLTQLKICELSEVLIRVDLFISLITDVIISTRPIPTWVHVSEESLSGRFANNSSSFKQKGDRFGTVGCCSRWPPHHGHQWLIRSVNYCLVESMETVFSAARDTNR